MEASRRLKLFNLYPLSRETVKLIVRIFFDSFKIHLFSIPRLKARSPKDLAAQVLHNNFIPPLFLAGWGHFRSLWISDFAVAFRGITRIFRPDQIRPIIQHIIDTSVKLGFTPTTITFKKGLDLPFSRADSFPWLLITIDLYMKWTHDKKFLTLNKPVLQPLLSTFISAHAAKKSLIHDHIAGDWIDTIRRPSSTWNNVCFLQMLISAKNLRLNTAVSPENFAKTFLHKRFHDPFVIDHAKSNTASVDGAVLLLYFGLFSASFRKKIACYLLSLDIFEPVPMKASITAHHSRYLPLLTKLTAFNYHNRARWLHLGLMFLNGIKKLRMDTKKYKNRVEEIFMRFGNCIETIDDNGGFYRGIISSEYGFTMTAGQYLELVS